MTQNGSKTTSSLHLLPGLSVEIDFLPWGTSSAKGQVLNGEGSMYGDWQTALRHLMSRIRPGGEETDGRDDDLISHSPASSSVYLPTIWMDLLWCNMLMLMLMLKRFLHCRYTLLFVIQIQLSSAVFCWPWRDILLPYTNVGVWVISGGPVNCGQREHCGLWSGLQTVA